jgi:hypothetical protein
MTTARRSPLPPVESGEAEYLLIARLTAVVKSFVSPDGGHRSLRSIYSPRGTCEVYPKGQHSGLCHEMFDTLEAAADWLEAHPEPTQTALFAEEAS